MSNEHNPIAQLISKLQLKWTNEVSPHENINLARWIIKPEQARLYEGFLKLESSEHGSIPDMLLVFLTPFNNIESHSKSLITDWIKTYRENAELIEQYKKENTTFNWDIDSFEKRITNDTNANNLLLVDMLSSFQKELEDKKPLTLALFPYTIEDTKAYSKWINSILKLGLPLNVRFMIFDHANERHFDILCNKHEAVSKSLSVPLDLEGAINKIASSGNPNDPEVQFRQCIIKMSKSVKNKDLNDLKKWGEKGLEVTQKTGEKGSFSSAHIIYASMLFNFKEYELIDDLLAKGLALAKQGAKAEDPACKTLLVQYYGFQASSKQFQKKYEDASNLFCKQADIATNIGLPQQSLNAWWMASNAIKKRDKARFKAIVEKAYKNGISLDKDTLKSTTMSFIAADYYNILEKEHNDNDCKKIDDFMLELDGKDWRSNVELQRKAMEKKKFSLSNLF
ncbi:hypothetical protein [uncultured Lacinutrix sp.]|uniref:hypothetical protein n=1 Tax=uncultured Lacinutrix sp. TaxID=574032 RepID=UPI00260B7D10|nr:hypothetical protein [uncultured Lacinutrix sp.]